LDPEAAKTAKDVMEENARKRKHQEEGQSENASSEDEELGSEQPKEGLKRGDAIAKKQKQSEASTKSEEAEARKKLKEERKMQKKEQQKEKKKAKETAKKEKQKEQQTKEVKAPATADATQKPESKPASDKNKKQKPSSKEDDSDDIDGEDAVAEGLSLEFNPEPTEQQSSSSSTPNSPDFDASTLQSGSSSISSIVPPSASNDASKDSSSEPKPLKPTPEQLKERLQKRLDELRAARQADGLNGKPARNRQELIEARRQKAEQRKAHKKLLRQKAKEEELQKTDEALARRFSPGGSGSLLASPRSPAESVGSSAANYSFGRVVFADGQAADASLSSLRDQPKRHGAHHDPAAALKAVEAKKARLDSMDTEKRNEIEEKDMWLNAKKRAHGERVRDDTSLLKKALKRKESAKKKSEREWKERFETVRKGKEMKQQKREDNLRKRRDEKGNKGKKSAGGGKKKARPGFEGSFKGKSGGKK
jgi:hypothetical protein